MFGQVTQSILANFSESVNLGQIDLILRVSFSFSSHAIRENAHCDDRRFGGMAGRVLLCS